MSTEKSCAKCVIDFCDAFNSSQSNNCNRHDNVYYCSTVCATIRNLTPAQKHAEELLEALKNLLNAEQCPNCNNTGAYQISEYDIEQCQWCDCVENSLFNRKNEAMQLIAKAEGRE